MAHVSRHALLAGVEEVAAAQPAGDAGDGRVADDLEVAGLLARQDDAPVLQEVAVVRLLGLARPPRNAPLTLLVFVVVVVVGAVPPILAIVGIAISVIFSPVGRPGGDARPPELEGTPGWGRVLARGTRPGRGEHRQRQRRQRQHGTHRCRYRRGTPQDVEAAPGQLQASPEPSSSRVRDYSSSWRSTAAVKCGVQRAHRVVRAGARGTSTGRLGL
mmetsp:Transcript_46215/g.147897  ORF Transcript_46215/g.147897 Transcript_46215/m.147897 type:complete len:216 (+) Transcript_46215:167-814(+)